MIIYENKLLFEKYKLSDLQNQPARRESTRFPGMPNHSWWYTCNFWLGVDVRWKENKSLFLDDAYGTWVYRNNICGEGQMCYFVPAYKRQTHRADQIINRSQNVFSTTPNPPPYKCYTHLGNAISFRHSCEFLAGATAKNYYGFVC